MEREVVELCLAIVVKMRASKRRLWGEWREGGKEEEKEVEKEEKREKRSRGSLFEGRGVEAREMRVAISVIFS